MHFSDMSLDEGGTEASSLDEGGNAAAPQEKPALSAIALTIASTSEVSTSSSLDSSTASAIASPTAMAGKMHFPDMSLDEGSNTTLPQEQPALSAIAPTSASISSSNSSTVVEPTPPGTPLAAGEQLLRAVFEANVQWEIDMGDAAATAALCFAEMKRRELLSADMVALNQRLVVGLGDTLCTRLLCTDPPHHENLASGAKLWEGKTTNMTFRPGVAGIWYLLHGNGTDCAIAFLYFEPQGIERTAAKSWAELSTHAGSGFSHEEGLARDALNNSKQKKKRATTWYKWRPSIVVPLATPILLAAADISAVNSTRAYHVRFPLASIPGCVLVDAYASLLAPGSTVPGTA